MVLPQADTIIDIGAYHCSFKRNFPNAIYYGFEPIHQAIHNSTEKVFNYALGNHLGTTFLHVCEDQPDQACFHTATVEGSYLFNMGGERKRIYVDIKPLDKVKLEITGNLFIKIDVCGAEAKVIHGGLRTLFNAMGCLITINTIELFQKQASSLEIMNLMDDLKFRYCGNFTQFETKDGHVAQVEALFLK